MLLLGLAFENLLKAIAASRGILSVDDQRLKLGREVSAHGGHGLTEMARNLDLQLTNAETDLLRRLEEFLVWAGRYPVPRLSDDYVVAHRDDVLKLNESDLDLSDALFDKLATVARRSA